MTLKVLIGVVLAVATTGVGPALSHAVAECAADTSQVPDSVRCSSDKAKPRCAKEVRQADAMALLVNQELASALQETGERNHLLFAPNVGGGAWSGFEPMIFEGSIAPQFALLSRRGINGGSLAGSIDRHWPLQIVIVPKVILRMLRQESSPVFTPSFMPRADFLFAVGKPEDGGTIDYLLVRLSHHSNGQADSYFVSTPSPHINRRYGSFSTNFLEVGISRDLWGLPRLISWIRGPRCDHVDTVNTHRDAYVSIELHPRAGAINRDATSTQGFMPVRAHFDTEGLLWEAGRADHGYTQLWLAANLTAYMGPKQQRFDCSRRFGARARMVLRPGGLADVALFGECYLGPDYYNLNFDRYLRRFSLGMLMWPLNRHTTSTGSERGDNIQ